MRVQLSQCSPLHPQQTTRRLPRRMKGGGLPQHKRSVAGYLKRALGQQVSQVHA